MRRKVIDKPPIQRRQMKDTIKDIERYVKDVVYQIIQDEVDRELFIEESALISQDVFYAIEPKLNRVVSEVFHSWRQDGGQGLSEEYVSSILYHTPSFKTLRSRIYDEVSKATLEKEEREAVYARVASNIVVKDSDIHDSHRGELFGTKRAYIDSEWVGGADISVLTGPKEVFIDYIVVKPEHRRKGVAEALARSLMEEFKDFDIMLTCTTPEGDAFFNSVFNVDSEGRILK